MNNAQIQAPPGNTIGFVNQCWTCIKPKYVFHSITNIPSLFHLPFLNHRPFISLIEPKTCQVTLIIIIRRFEITDGDGNVALKILGPWCTYSCAGDVEFKVVEKLVDVLSFSYLFVVNHHLAFVTSGSDAGRVSRGGEDLQAVGRTPQGGLH